MRAQVVQDIVRGESVTAKFGIFFVFVERNYKKREEKRKEKEEKKEEEGEKRKREKRGEKIHKLKS